MKRMHISINVGSSIDSLIHRVVVYSAGALDINKPLNTPVEKKQLTTNLYVWAILFVGKSP